ncbi:uncharacterized protein LOC120330115 isoform X1 [Styela clava]
MNIIMKTVVILLWMFAYTTNVSSECVPTVTTRRSQNGTIKSPRYPDMFTENDCSHWAIPHGAEVNSSLIIRIKENELLTANKLNRKFLTGNLVVGGENMAIFTEGTCVIVLQNGLHCQNVEQIKTPINCKQRVVLFQENKDSSLEIVFTPNGLADWMGGRYFKLEYEYVPCVEDYNKIERAMAKFQAANKNTGSGPEGTLHGVNNHSTLYLTSMIVLSVVAGLEGMILLIFLIRRYKRTTISYQKTSNVEFDTSPGRRSNIVIFHDNHIEKI